MMIFQTVQFIYIKLLNNTGYKIFTTEAQRALNRLSVYLRVLYASVVINH